MKFKTGDTVYHWKFGKGTIKNTESRRVPNYPIDVDFGFDNTLTFTQSGEYYTDEPPTLSFNPYDLVNGGFSQERPLPDIKEGDIVYVKGSFDTWEMRFFSHFSNGKLYTFQNQKKSGKTIDWDEYSITNPLI